MLWFNGISTIEAGAIQCNFTFLFVLILVPPQVESQLLINVNVFQGKFGKSFIRLDTNLLTRLDADVFLDVAQQMLP